MGCLGRFRPRQRHRDAERPRGGEGGRRCALRALRHRGGPDRRRAAAQRRRDRTASARSPAPYAATKARAEQAVRAANGDGFETVVVRPRFVWGAGDTTLLPAMVEMVKSGRFAWIGGGRQLTESRTSTTLSKDCCSARKKAVAARPTSSPTANLSSSASSSRRCCRRRESTRRAARSRRGWPVLSRPPVRVSGVPRGCRVSRR